MVRYMVEKKKMKKNLIYLVFFIVQLKEQEDPTVYIKKCRIFTGEEEDGE